jgi:hypothetical protein
LRIAFFHRAGNSLVCKQTFIMNVSVGSIILIHILLLLTPNYWRAFKLLLNVTCSSPGSSRCMVIAVIL